MSAENTTRPRGAARAATDFAIEIYHTDGKTLRGISRLLDISISGACLESTSDLGESEEFQIRLLLGRRTLVTIPVQVIWKRYFSKSFQYGLRFNEYPAEVRAAISDFVRRRAEDRVGAEDIIN